MKKASLTTLRKTLKLNPKSPIPISSNHIFFTQNPSKPTFTSQNHDYPSKPYLHTPPKTLSFLHFSSNPFRKFTTSFDDPQNPISQISSSQQKINELGDAFEKAETASQMIEVFEKMERLIDGSQLGPLLFKIAHKLDLQGDSPDRVFEFADKCLKLLELNENLNIKGNERSLALAMCLRCLGSACLGLRRFNEGLGYLNRANRIVGKLDEEGVNDRVTVKHVLHAVHLYLARTKVAMGRRKDAIENVKKCLEIKEMMLEKNSVEMGNAYREMAEAYVVLSNFGEALPYCEKAVEIHEVQQLGSNLVEVGHSRSLLGVIYKGLEQHEKALEQNQLSQKAMQNWARMMDQLRAEIDAANMQIASGKFDEAINTLKGVVSQTDKESEDRAKIFVSMAKALCKQDKFLEAKGYLQMACGILDKKKKKLPSEAYMEISMQYESMNEFETAISILKKILTMLEKEPNEQHAVGSASARIGQLLLSTGKVKESIPYLEDATKLLTKYFEVGYVYYNLGVAYLELDRPQSAAQVFATAKDIMDASLGPHHVDSIKACQNLSKAYSAMKSDALAINFQEKAVEAWSGLASRAQDGLKEAQRVLHQLKVKDCGESDDN